MTKTIPSLFLVIFFKLRLRHALLPASLGLLALLLVGSSARSQSRQAGEAETEARIDLLLPKLSLDEKLNLIGGVDSMFIRAVPAIGLPKLKTSDGPLGIRTWGPAIGYAGGIALAATFDAAMARELGVSIAHDARARAVHVMLAPAVNIYRAPMNSRNFEYFGEDPYLASRMAVSYIRGMQSQGVVATVKHFAANNSDYDRHNINSIIDERTLREIYLPAFEAAVKEGQVGAVMDSYNLVNGEHSTQSEWLNTEVLKKEWGFRGILMSDWWSTYDAVAAANSGLDVEMPYAEAMTPRKLRVALDEGKISQATVDDKVHRILRVAVKFGFLDRDQKDNSISLDSPQGRDIALQSAEESIVLLKNENHLLPLETAKVRAIAVIGPNSYPAVPSGGGSAQVDSFAPISLLAGVNNAVSKRTNVTWNAGVIGWHTIFHPQFFRHTPFTTDKEGSQHGLKLEIFAGDNAQGQLQETRTVGYVDNWGQVRFAHRSQIRHFYRWTGYYAASSADAQRFVVGGFGEDSYRLYVDGKLVLEQGEHEGQYPRFVDLTLPQGQPVPIRLEYFPMTDESTLGFGAIPAKDMVDPEAAELARSADVVLLSVGFDPYTEAEGHDRTFELPPGQDELIQAVEAANPNTVVILTAGGSVATERWIDQTPALLHTWYLGQEGGRAIAEVLFGVINPSGKLPVSFERHLEDNPAIGNYYEPANSKDVRYTEGVFVGYRGYESKGVHPLFPFGYGLSYTTFRFSHLAITPEKANAGSPVQVKFDVSNIGERAGAEVVQLYVGDPSSQIARPPKELKGFLRVLLKPGETRRVTLQLNRRSLAYWDITSRNWKVDPGKFVAYVGDSSENLPLQADFTIK